MDYNFWMEVVKASVFSRIKGISVFLHFPKKFLAGIDINEIVISGFFKWSFLLLKRVVLTWFKTLHLLLQTNHALLEEIKEINRGLIDTVVDVSEEDVDPAAASEGGDGTVVKCSFSAVALGPNLKSQYASAQMVCLVYMLSLFLFAIALYMFLN